jgi:hypothetical protein
MLAVQEGREAGRVSRVGVESGDWCRSAPGLREDEHGVPGLLQCVKGRSNGGLNLRLAADPCHAVAASRVSAAEGAALHGKGRFTGAGMATSAR